jgi:glycosyltransferase involved in cell wall biosynthesis
VRVLITGDTVGGVFTYVVELAAGLESRGVETAVALMGRSLSLDQRRALRDAGVTRSFASEFALEWMDDPWRDVERAGEWLLEIEDHIRPDVVHLNGYAHGALPWRAPVLVVAHSCVVSWFEAVRGHEPPPEWGRYRAAVGDGLASASMVVAPTRAMLDAVVRHHRPQAETVVIPNGRSAGRVRRAKEPFVLAAGRLWDDGKNLAALDRVAPRLDWPVLVAGDEPPPHARPHHVRLVGRLSNATLEEHYARASVFAAPARYEPFGLAPLEAALAGCALVLGDIASLREVWGDAAVYAAPDDHAHLEHALARLIRDENLRVRFAGAANERARRYTPERMVEAYLDVYERLATEVLEPEQMEAVT